MHITQKDYQPNSSSKETNIAKKINNSNKAFNIDPTVPITSNIPPQEASREPQHRNAPTWRRICPKNASKIPPREASREPHNLGERGQYGKIQECTKIAEDWRKFDHPLEQAFISTKIDTQKRKTTSRTLVGPYFHCFHGALRTLRKKKRLPYTCQTSFFMFLPVFLHIALQSL